MNGRAAVQVYDSRYGPIRATRARAKANFTEGRARLVAETEWKPFAIALNGWLRPFDTVPAYDLTARLGRLPGDTSSVWLERLLGSGTARVAST